MQGRIPRPAISYRVKHGEHCGERREKGGVYSFGQRGDGAVKGGGRGVDGPLSRITRVLVLAAERKI
jgi:hypothetical protein